MLHCSLVDTSVVGTRSARELAALGPGTMLCDYSAYIFTFLAIASAPPAVCLFRRTALARLKIQIRFALPHVHVLLCSCAGCMVAQIFILPFAMERGQYAQAIYPLCASCKNVVVP